MLLSFTTSRCTGPSASPSFVWILSATLIPGG
jgi:hypothetical protein